MSAPPGSLYLAQAGSPCAQSGSATPRFPGTGRLALFLLPALLGLAACREEPTPAGPADVLVDFIQTMQRVHGNPEMGAHAISLLWEPARKNLAERARRASALSGRKIEPGEMLAPSWFSLHLVPDQFETRLDGNWAEITTTSRDGRQVRTRAVLEKDNWRILLELPELPEIRQRTPIEER